jgi:hypothetical protein
VPDVGHSVLTSSACARRGFAHFMASEPMGECHLYAQHHPPAARRVRSLPSILQEIFKDFPLPNVR